MEQRFAAAPICEHPFVTPEGSAYARFRRALDARDLFGASAAALELHHVGLADALELTLIYLDREPAKYDRAAVRWHARLCADARLSLDDSLAALGLLAALRGRRDHDAARSLADLHRKQPDAATRRGSARALGRACPGFTTRRTGSVRSSAHLVVLRPRALNWGTGRSRLRRGVASVSPVPNARFCDQRLAL